MMRWIVESSLRLRHLVIILALVLMIVGVAQLRSMPVDVYPEFNPPMVEVQTEALGLSASEVESLITVPMEADLLNGVAWMENIYSESVAGMSSILMVFEPDADPIRIRQMVQERLTQAYALPNVSKPPQMINPLSTTSRVMMVGLSSQDVSLIDMSVLAHWNIKPRLSGVEGVANVAIWGQRDRQLQVQVDPERLNAAGVTLGQIIATTGEALWVSPLSYLEASSPGTAGFIDTPNQRLGIHHRLPISSAEDLGKVAVVGREGMALGDVADVVEDHQPLIGDASLNNSPSLLLVIEKFPGANTMEVTRRVEDALAAMRPGLTGIEIDSSVFRPANYIEQAIGNISLSLLIGAALMLIVLGAFFYGWRTTLICIVTIPLSLIASGVVLYLRGATFNMMYLAGLTVALGAIIDDAIGDVDTIARRVRQFRLEQSSRSTASIVTQAVLEQRSPIMYATLIMLLSVVPVFFLPGMTGNFLQPFALAFVLALAVSLLVALIVTPALSLMLLPGARQSRTSSPLVERLHSAYTRTLSRTVHTPYRWLGIAGAVILIGAAVLPLMNLSLRPSLKQTDLLIQWDGPPSTSRQEMNRITAQASQELRAIPGIRNVGSQVGRAVTGDQVVGINSAQIWVSIGPEADYESTMAAIHGVVDGYPGLTRTLQTYQPERIDEALVGVEHDIVVRVYGNDLDILRNKAQEVIQSVSQVSGIANLRADLPTEEPQVEIEVDLAKAEQHHIKPGDVRRAAAALLAGLQVGNLYEKQKVFDVVVWGVPDIRTNLTDISDLLIDTPGGNQVRLGDVADVRIAPTPVTIRRDAVSRYVDVVANLEGRGLADVRADIKGRLQTIEFPLEYHAEILDASTQQQAARQRILLGMILAVIGMFLLLQAAFSSWSLALLTVLTLPMALAGGVLAALAGGGVFSLGSLIGFLAVLGVAARNCIVMISHLRQLEAHEGEPFGAELVLRGARDRVVPIVMSALATGLVMLPLLIGGALPGHEIVAPMAIVILGGLVTSTVLSLFVIPSLYLRFGSSPAPVTSPAPYATAGAAAD